MKKSCALFVLCLLVLNSFAQSAFGDNETFSSTPFSSYKKRYCNSCRKYHYSGCTPTNPPTPVPFDGGLTVLLAAGAAYGVRKRKALAKKG